jgi:hypothetical protein
MLTAMFEPSLPPNPFDQDPPHRLRCRRKEVSPAVPMLGLFRVHQPDVGLVDESGGLERLPGLLPRHLGGSELPQFLVNQR